jgi:hypothetical protein
VRQQIITHVASTTRSHAVDNPPPLLAALGPRDPFVVRSRMGFLVGTPALPSSQTPNTNGTEVPSHDHPREDRQQPGERPPLDRTEDPHKGRPPLGSWGRTVVVDPPDPLAPTVRVGAARPLKGGLIRQCGRPLFAGTCLGNDTGDQLDRLPKGRLMSAGAAALEHPVDNCHCHHDEDEHSDQSPQAS